MVMERLLNLTVLDWKELLAKGISRLGSELDSDKMELEVVNNGVRINIVCDEEKQREAAKVWKNHVIPELEGEE